jgi:16S rRNA (guanine527-N7)-methyltransferase
MKIVVPPATIGHYLLLLEELLRWNKKFNLTAIEDYEEGLEKHIVDSLTLCPFLNQAKCLLDMGSGAGFPALPLKIACPDMTVYSVEASLKKVFFQRHMARKLSIFDFHIIHSRIENLKLTAGQELPLIDIVVSRALTSLPQFLALAKPFLSDTGKAIAMKGPGCAKELGAVMANGDWSLKERINISLPASGVLREVLVFTVNAA